MIQRKLLQAFFPAACALWLTNGYCAGNKTQDVDLDPHNKVWINPLESRSLGQKSLPINLPPLPNTEKGAPAQPSFLDERLSKAEADSPVKMLRSYLGRFRVVAIMDSQAVIRTTTSPVQNGTSSYPQNNRVQQSTSTYAQYSPSNGAGQGMLSSPLPQGGDLGSTGRSNQNYPQNLNQNYSNSFSYQSVSYLLSSGVPINVIEDGWVMPEIKGKEVRLFYLPSNKKGKLSTASLKSVFYGSVDSMNSYPTRYGTTSDVVVPTAEHGWDVRNNNSDLKSTQMGITSIGTTNSNINSSSSN